jgi:hypothetical protein
MRYLPILILALLTTATIVVMQPGRQPDGSYLIPTGQILTPAGTSIEVNDRPLGMTLSPDGRWLAAVTGSNFAPRALHLIEMSSQKLIQTLTLGDSFVGVAFSSDGSRLYVGGGQNQNLKRFRFQERSFVEEPAIPLQGAPRFGNRESERSECEQNPRRQLSIYGCGRQNPGLGIELGWPPARPRRQNRWRFSSGCRSADRHSLNWNCLCD